MLLAFDTKGCSIISEKLYRKLLSDKYLHKFCIWRIASEECDDEDMRYSGLREIKKDEVGE